MNLFSFSPTLFAGAAIGSAVALTSATGQAEDTFQLSGRAIAALEPIEKAPEMFRHIGAFAEGDYFFSDSSNRGNLSAGFIWRPLQGQDALVELFGGMSARGEGFGGTPGLNLRFERFDGHLVIENETRFQIIPQKDFVALRSPFGNSYANIEVSAHPTVLNFQDTIRGRLTAQRSDWSSASLDFMLHVDYTSPQAIGAPITPPTLQGGIGGTFAYNLGGCGSKSAFLIAAGGAFLAGASPTLSLSNGPRAIYYGLPNSNLPNPYIYQPTISGLATFAVTTGHLECRKLPTDVRL